ncbi:hypothetical protein AAFC00_003399 [Neodothiora populina]|uniref:Uncharacterized protein n=1 Tax=Neodothiora populina TaxID=2781224 RepID=A0ABR3PEG5_9PEZI
MSTKTQEEMERESNLVHTVDGNNVSLGDPEQKGLLSFIGDPAGKALNKGLSPVGSVVGGLAQPFGSGESNTDKLKGNKSRREESARQEREADEAIGGKAQTGQNPLGL